MQRRGDIRVTEGSKTSQMCTAGLSKVHEIHPLDTTLPDDESDPESQICGCQMHETESGNRTELFNQYLGNWSFQYSNLWARCPLPLERCHRKYFIYKKQWIKQIQISNSSPLCTSPQVTNTGWGAAIFFFETSIKKIFDTFLTSVDGLASRIFGNLTLCCFEPYSIRMTMTTAILDTLMEAISEVSLYLSQHCYR
jgi:hypothetical protein